MVSESRVTSATSVPILVFLGLSVVLDLGSMYATDRQTDRQTSDRQTSDVRRAPSLNASALWGRGHNNTAGQAVGLQLRKLCCKLMTKHFQFPAVKRID